MRVPVNIYSCCFLSIVPATKTSISILLNTAIVSVSKVYIFAGNNRNV
uniref:Uncharacterized protein n=1 Tax=Heterorhabditis bacteriophora TaxID=37862 RepID=A0A1I7X1X4_HETBA